MRPAARVIRSRWWALVLRLVAGVLCPLFLIVAISKGVARAGGPITVDFGPLLLLPAFGYMLFAVIIVSINGLRYHVEVDANGFGVVGLLFTRAFLWSEITEIGEMSNFRLPGYHVGIRVDGSNNHRRNRWLFWHSTHRIQPGMEMGGLELSRYLRRRWRQWQRSSLDSSAPPANAKRFS